MKKRAFLLALAAVLCVACTGCTTAFSNASAYFNNAKGILATLVPGKSSNASDNAQRTATPLDAPSNFTIDEQGNYSFSGVEGADYYVIYFCAPDTTEDDADFLFSSEQIHAQAGVDTYTGTYRDVINVAYGEYLARVVACPQLGDQERSMSAWVSTPFTAAGPQEQPEFEYFWDPFINTLSLQLSNISAYTYEAYPERIEITITNVNDSTDQTVLALENVSEENIEISTDALSQGEVYSISALAVSNSPYVSNPVTDSITVTEELSLGELNILTDGYFYKHGWFTYPLLCEDFDLANGGTVGKGKLVSELSGPYTFEFTPTTTTAGSSYSYLFEADTFVTQNGTLELFSDGTAEIYTYGAALVHTESISGIWLDNGNGKATLCFSNTSLTSR